MADTRISSLGVAFVDAGHLLSFRSVVGRDVRSDMLDSLLFAQLAADKQYSRLREAAEWWKAYVDTTSRVAWRMTQYTYVAYTPPDATFTIEDIVLSRLEQYISKDDRQLVHESISTLRQLPDEDPAVKVYETSTHSEYAVNLQVGVVSERSGLSGVGAVLRTTQPLGRIFDTVFETDDVEGAMMIASYNGDLNEAVYATIRQSVIEKLGAKRTELIRSVEMGG